MKPPYNTNYPGIDDLRNKAKARVPRFAFEYLDGGCNEDVNLYKNTAELREVELKPYYLNDHAASDLKTELFGHVYDAPFGIAPIGLQGLLWPNAPEILAKAAFKHNIPFILSTVSTSSIEGGDHIINILKIQLKQVMEQVCAEKVSDLPKHLIKSTINGKYQ